MTALKLIYGNELLGEIKYRTIGMKIDGVRRIERETFTKLKIRSATESRYIE